MDIFGDFESLKDFRDLYRKAPRKVPRVAAGVLNSLAFETRAEALNILASRLTIRKPAFARRHMRVDKARTTAALSSQRSTAGSIARGSFTGWVEQQDGDKGNRTHFATIAGRRGSEGNVVPNRFRLGKDYPAQGDTRLGVFLAMMARRPGRKPFVLKNGLFKFVGKKKIRMLQGFQKPKKVKRLAWMTMARRNAVASNPTQKLWARQVKFILTPRR